MRGALEGATYIRVQVDGTSLSQSPSASSVVFYFFFSFLLMRTGLMLLFAFFFLAPPILLLGYLWRSAPGEATRTLLSSAPVHLFFFFS